MAMSKRKPPLPPRGGTPSRRQPGQQEGPSPGRAAHADGGWIYGHHAVLAAIANPRRQCLKLLATPAGAAELAAAAERGVATQATAAEQGIAAQVPLEVVDRQDLERLLPPGAVHQGMALLATPLEETHLEDFLRSLGDAAEARLIVLDQASDPRNVGAVLRSAAAFGAHAVILQERHSPAATGALAKAASGALEVVPMIRVTNIVRALDRLKQAGFWCVALDAGAALTLAEFRPASRVALVIGAEGKGLRRFVAASCDESVRIPIAGTVESLNVSVAAAIALYELSRLR